MTSRRDEAEAPASVKIARSHHVHVPGNLAADDPVHDHEPCDVCGKPAPLDPWLPISLAGTVDAWICRCGRCGFRQVRPRLTAGEIARLYSDDYFDSLCAVGFGDYARQQQRYARDAFFLARELAAMAEAGRLLEVGCALGFLLDGLQSRSAWAVTGIDISGFAVAFAREAYGLDVRQATLEKAGFPDGSFDFTVQKDLLEHVGVPRRHLLETRRILKPGGHALFVTPVGEANLRPLARLAEGLARDSHNQSLPLLDQGHLSFFTREHLERLLDETGFEIVRFRSIRVRRGLRALGWLPARKRRHRAVPAGHARTPGANAPDRDAAGDLAAETRRRELITRIRSELEEHRTAMRSWQPYLWMRHLTERLDSLPAAWPLGNDFEILARRT